MKETKTIREAFEDGMVVEAVFNDIPVLFTSYHLNDGVLMPNAVFQFLDVPEGYSMYGYGCYGEKLYADSFPIDTITPHIVNQGNFIGTMLLPINDKKVIATLSPEGPMHISLKDHPSNSFTITNKTVKNIYEGDK